MQGHDLLRGQATGLLDELRALPGATARVSSGVATPSSAPDQNFSHLSERWMTSTSLAVSVGHLQARPGRAAPAPDRSDRRPAPPTCPAAARCRSPCAPSSETLPNSCRTSSFGVLMFFSSAAVNGLLRALLAAVVGDEIGGRGVGDQALRGRQLGGGQALRRGWRSATSRGSGPGSWSPAGRRGRHRPPPAPASWPAPVSWITWLSSTISRRSYSSWIWHIDRHQVVGALELHAMTRIVGHGDVRGPRAAGEVLGDPAHARPATGRPP